jgi:hypothetical protein
VSGRRGRGTHVPQGARKHRETEERDTDRETERDRDTAERDIHTVPVKMAQPMHRANCCVRAKGSRNTCNADSEVTERQRKRERQTERQRETEIKTETDRDTLTVPVKMAQPMYWANCCVRAKGSRR